MAGKITADGREHVGEILDVYWSSGSVTNTLTYVEIGTGSTAATDSDSGIETALASGGRIVADSGYPKIVTGAGGPEIHVKATFTAGSFTVGTPITEAVWVDAAAATCGGRVILDVAKDPSASEPLDVTIKFPINDDD